MKRTIAAIALATSVLATTGQVSQAAYEFTYNGRTEIVCTWTTIGATMYKASLTGNVASDAKTVKLPKEHEANAKCREDAKQRKAARAAAKAEKAAAKAKAE